MTALPDPEEFLTTLGVNAENGVQLHPDVRERFWGYEVRMTQTRTFGMSVVRSAACVAGLGFGLLGVSLLIWPSLMQGIGLEGHSVAALACFCLAVIAAHVYALHRPVRVQIDTSAGELREVIDRRFGGEAVLARYGLDAVAGVDVVASQTDPSFGQVHVRVKGYGVLPVGDGAVSALRPLRDQLAVDCGLETPDVRPAVWNGPLPA